MDKRLAYLQQLGAESLGHWNGNLIAHLQSTRDLLASWGAAAYLQDAGLFHAVYGTDGYPSALSNAGARAEIASIIGSRAEEVVYIYGACDRDFLYPQLQSGSGANYRDRFSGEIYPLAGRLLEDVCELTAANELDLARDSARFRRKHGAIRHRFFRDIKQYLSSAALRASDEILGECVAESEAAV